jgi:peptidoglycan hydrolase-like protein with peptidoglycan-binding domain
LYQNGDDANLLWEYAFADLYIQKTDLEFPGLALRWDDYYPALGDKKIIIKSRCNLTGLNVRAQINGTNNDVGIKTAVDGNKAPVATTQFDDKAAVFYLSGLNWAPSNSEPEKDKVTIKFTLFNKDGSEANEISGIWHVKNNANTNLAEVLTGEAVFVCDLQRNADGTFNTTGGVYHAALGDNHKGESTGDANGQKEVDYLQELLNQVIPRKRGVTYTLMDEDGYFGTTTESGIHTFKQAFHVTNTGEGSIFRKLMKDYGQENTAFWEDKLADKLLLVGTTQRTDPANSPDNLINTVAGNTVNDTGLYELYENVVKVFVDAMIKEAERYENATGFQNSEGNWKPRTFPNDAAQINGVSYCFGCKDSVESFNATVTKCQSESTADIRSHENDGIANNEYRGNISDTDCVYSASGKNWPGLLENEWELWYDDPNDPDDEHGIIAFDPQYWAGIDCSGFVQRSLLQRRNIAPGLDITIPSPPAWINSQAFFADDRVLYLPNTGTAEEKLKLRQKLKKGDLVRYNGHITIVYSDKATRDGNYKIIHAYGVTPYTYPSYDTQNAGLIIFSRKVVITWDNISATPKGFGRIKLWKN